jgi:hypothetical protein
MQAGRSDVDGQFADGDFDAADPLITYTENAF